MILLVAICAAAGMYQVLAILGCLRKRIRPPAGPRLAVNVSIFKPIRGSDAGLREAIQSHVALTGEFELLCGVASLDDPAVALLREFPKVRVVECRTKTSNQKAGVLLDLAAASDSEIIIVNDADIRVPPDYLERVVPPLADPRMGLVTCLYRPVGATFAARFEGLGVSTDFAPSTLVARMMGVDEFAMGSTMAFRRADLEKIGGFAAIADYLADDYQLGHRIHVLGLKCVIADTIVETRLGGGWKDVWRHQLRWARTIRVSKLGGYLGLPLTNATLWALVAACFGRFEIALALLGVRMLMAIEAGWFLMRSRDAWHLLWAIPLRDLFAFAVWIAGLSGNTVEWRGRKLTLDREGRILDSH